MVDIKEYWSHCLIGQGTAHTYNVQRPPKSLQFVPRLSATWLIIAFIQIQAQSVHIRREAAIVPHPLADLLLRYARQAHCAADADGDRLGREAHLRGGQGGG